ncbi:MAG: DUF4386 domain-containing protein [Acidobacteriota bacterium]|nr:DUF4386 domain-containing protein [Acidobacteriota bacterium]
MHDFDVEASPRFYARLAGVLYLLIIVTGIFGEVFVRNAFVVTADPAATAIRITADPSLWRLGTAVVLFEHLLDVPVALILYLLMRPVSRFLALLALLFTLVSTAALVAFKLTLLVPIFLLGNAQYLKALDPGLLQALSYVAIRADAYGFGIGLVYFGAFCLVVGHLIFRSSFFPRVLGVLMGIAGLCYLTNSFALIAAHAFADTIYPLILVPAFVAELSFCLWLIVKGVDEERWRARASLRSS